MPTTVSTRQRNGKRSGKTVQEIVTSQIIQALEAGVIPWRQPWTNRGAAFPMSMATGRPYRGINVFLLLAAATTQGYRSAWWGSLKKIREHGGRVRDDQFGKPVLVILWKVPYPQGRRRRRPGDPGTAARP